MELKDVKVGSRVLYNSKYPSWQRDLAEVTVLEFSPSKKRVKFRYLSGIASWEDVKEWESNHLIVEVLKEAE